MDHPAIQTANLGRTYRRSRWRRPFSAEPRDPAEIVALQDVSLTIPPGELFGLLGPNGAGKTTLIKVLTTLLMPSVGCARVDGFDVVREAQAVRRCINMVSGGESCGYGLLTVRENLWLFSQLYGVPSSVARQRIDSMLDIVGLADRADTKISRLSTGLRQKMNFCRGFVTDPKILFLDEPTLGLDVTAARTIRRFLRSWLSERHERTLLLTTYYLMEADQLCDRIAVIDHGKVLACDTPAALKRRLTRQPRYALALASGSDGWQQLHTLPGVLCCRSQTAPTTIELEMTVTEEAVVSSIVQRIVNGGGQVLTLQRIEPSLEDVFLDLVGPGTSIEREQS